MNGKLEIKLGIKEDTLKKMIQIGLVGIVILQFVTILWLNYVKVEHTIDYDSSLAIRHGIEMWKNHTLFLDGWSYFSTLETDNVCFFAIPLYLLCGNLPLSLAIGHGIFYLIFACVICDIFKNLGKSKYCGLLSTILIFIPYDFGQVMWTNMLFFSVGQYEFRVLTMLLVMDALLIGEGNTLSFKNVALIAVGTMINFWTSLSCGNYVLLMVIFPLVLWIGIKGIRSKAWECKKYQACILMLNILSSVIGWKMHNMMAGASFNNDKNLISASSFFQNIENAITGIFMLLGGLNGSDDISVLSITGMICILKIVFTIFVIGFVIWSYVKKNDSKCLLEMSILVAFVNLTVLFLTNTTYGSPVFEFRYHIVWITMVLCCCGLVFECYKDMQYGNLVIFSLLIVAIAFQCSGTYVILKLYPTDSCAKKILEVADENDVSAIYLYDMKTESHQIRVKDLDKYCISFSIDEAGQISADTGNFYMGYEDALNTTTKNILVVKEEDYNNLPQYYTENYTYLASISLGLNVYIAEHNPWDLISGISVHRKASVDYVYSEGYERDGVIENGKLKVEGNNNYVLWGPYREANEGIYNITIYCEQIADQKIQESRAEVYVDNGEQELAVATFDDKIMAFRMDNVKLGTGMRPEFRIWAGKGETFLVDKLVFEKVE